jgi:hypothetical protein
MQQLLQEGWLCKHDGVMEHLEKACQEEGAAVAGQHRFPHQALQEAA